MTIRAITSDQLPAIATAFTAGVTAKNLAAEYGCSDTAIRNALKRAGVRPPNRRHPNTWTGAPEQVADMLAAYKDGASVKRLAQRFHCRDTVISAALATAGIKLHPGGRAHPVLSPEQGIEVAAMYAEGSSLPEIAEEIGCSVPVIASAVRRYGSMRRMGKPKYWNDERRGQVLKMADIGASVNEIAEAVGAPYQAVNMVIQHARSKGELARYIAPSGAAHHAWNGGRLIDSGGYVRIRLNDDERHLAPATPKYHPEHRIVVARALERALKPTESVHHINGDKQDNRLENLQLRQGAHGKGVRAVCGDCGSHAIEFRPI
jgi:transposase-like protein